MTEAPRAVTVVVATRDRAGRLAALLESLEGQSIGTDAFDVVVVDDASRDATAELLRRERSGGKLALRVISRRESGGPAVARNQGWRAAEAPLVAFTDDDCEATTAWLEAGLAAYRRREGAVIQGRTEPLPSELDRIGPFTRTLVVREGDPYYQTCNILYPRDLLERLGGFDERYPKPGGEDTDLGWRAIELGAEVVFEPRALVHHAVDDLGPVGRLRVALRWSDAMYVFRRHPGLRREICSYRIFWKESHALLAQAALALFLARRSPAAALFTLPYARNLVVRCAEVSASRAYAPYLALNDLVEAYAALRGAVRHRVLVI